MLSYGTKFHQSSLRLAADYNIVELFAGTIVA
jgi:hypothetical protein